MGKTLVMIYHILVLVEESEIKTQSDSSCAVYILEKYWFKESLSSNVFSDIKRALMVKDIFHSLWRRFKRLNVDVGTSVTIYSFRHSGAIEIFKRTGSITKLQKAMGHSSINVSLTYLRGLEVAELTEEDMPVI